MQDVERESEIVAAVLLELNKWLKISPKSRHGGICKAMHVEVSGHNSGLGPVMLDTRSRLRKRAKALGITPPVELLDKDGALTVELLCFCKQTDTTLEWLFDGEPSGSTHSRSM
ncbi:hypothetical protein Z948_791 [Sulfitobacter donghicola DSW-25 = KCTC 12864 = JCM 14565]|uniref:Uncharacterized protein n=2 Tax=Sulfitobacter TaxID=60136 RepID=A0A073IIZ5_9RHOB|nr:hypothetical protein DSW25_06180 [Sulfitobacter donghicola DSW-25 = KCTC 12864 = JCM 14565]KIN67086.1 hypothetical protein Z948_791 [Sulfitobacter donghicola DSW-25 = KCTC 12864 = JCM 14565]